MIPAESNPEGRPRRRRRMVIWVVALGVPLLAALVVVIVLLASAGSIDQGRPDSVVRGYLDAIIRHEPAKAYGVLCAEQRASQTEDEWADQTLMVERYDFVDVHPDQSGDGSQATVDVGVANATGRRVERTLTVVKEDGRWWVCDW